METSVSKDQIKEASKEVLLKGILLSYFLGSVFVILCWSTVLIWLWIYKDEYSTEKLGTASLLLGSTTVFIYGLWAFRRALVKSFRIILDIILDPAIKNRADQLSERIIDYGEKERTREILESIGKFEDWVKEKTKNFPSLILFILKIVVRKLGYSEGLEAQVKAIKNDDKKTMSDGIHKFFRKMLISRSEKFIPKFIVIILIVFNILSLIGLWFT